MFCTLLTAALSTLALKPSLHVALFEHLCGSLLKGSACLCCLFPFRRMGPCASAQLENKILEPGTGVNQHLQFPK